MDASPMAPVVALRWSDSPQLPRTAAWLVVVLLHALLGAWLWQSGRPKNASALFCRVEPCSTALRERQPSIARLYRRAKSSRAWLEPTGSR